MPKLMLTCLRGGKGYGSKVKFAKFGLIYEPDLANSEVVKDVNTLYGLVRKNLAAGKQGEAGLKPISGSFICTMDTIADALKPLEEAIKASKMENVKIFICCNATDVYNEATMKYEMEGAKGQYEFPQMIDFYIKFLNDHPLITYLEDPMANIDLPGWHLLTVNYIQINRKDSKLRNQK